MFSPWDQIFWQPLSHVIGRSNVKTLAERKNLKIGQRKNLNKKKISADLRSPSLPACASQWGRPPKQWKRDKNKNLERYCTSAEILGDQFGRWKKKNRRQTLAVPVESPVGQFTTEVRSAFNWANRVSTTSDNSNGKSSESENRGENDYEKKTTKNPISSRSSVTTSSPLLSDQISGQQLSFQHQETTNSHFFFPSFANWFVSSDRQVEQLSVKARDWPMLVHRMTHAKRCKRQQQRACNCVPKKLWLVLHKKNGFARWFLSNRCELPCQKEGKWRLEILLLTAAASVNEIFRWPVELSQR